MRRRVSGLLLGVALLAAAVLPAAAAPKPYDQMAPENTTLYMSIRNVSEFLKRFEASPLGEAWNGEDMKPFVGKMGDAFDVLFKEAGKTLGYSLKDYKDLLQGEAAIILGDPAAIEFKAERPEIPLAFLLDVGSRKEKAQEFLAKNLELIEKEGKTQKRVEDFRGTKLVCLEGKESKPGDLKAVVFAVADDILALSFSQTFLQDILANRADAAMKSLSEHPDYRALRGRFGSEADLFAYAHVGRWLDNLPKIVKASGGADIESNLGMVLQVLDTLGIAGLRSIVISGTMSAEGITQTVFLGTAGAPKGLLKVIACQPQSLRFPAAVPEDVSQASIVLVDFEALWGVVESTVKMVQSGMAGGAAPGIDPLAAFEEQLGISVKRDIFGSFGKQVVIYERLKKPYTVQSQAMAIMIELRDKAKFQAALDKLIALVPFLQKKEYLGRPLYTVAMPGMEDGGDPNVPQPPMPAICLTDTHFVFANQKELAEEAIRRVGKDVRSVNDAPCYKALEARYPASATAISYGTPEGFDYLFHMAKELAKGELPGLPPGVLNLDDADPNDTGVKFFKAIQDAFGRLPNPTVFTSRIAGGVGWGFADEKGIGITSKFLFKTTTK